MESITPTTDYVVTEPFNPHVEVDGFHAARRKRFIAALDRGDRVLFSVGNAAELSGDSFLLYESRTPQRW